MAVHAFKLLFFNKIPHM